MALESGSGIVDLINATKGTTLNVGEIVKAVQALGILDFSPGTTGYIQLKNGLMVNWGTGTTTSGSGSVTFEKAFPTTCFCVLLTETGTVAATHNSLIANPNPTKTACSVYGAATESLNFFYVALGN